ncbi:Smg-4/UPF3 family-domain-containing protein [Cladochytrium replicatum]|nr:Smg-4/UPF3 family-domain-containing protein [Cladochytrium replicatum]
MTQKSTEPKGELRGSGSVKEPILQENNFVPASVPKEGKKKRSRGKKASTQPLVPTKVVVRHLPSNLPEEIFKQSVSKWLEFSDYFGYVPGKLAKSKAKLNLLSRAYLNFKTPETLIEFFNAYDGHLFVDNKGIESRALVELAPFQRISKKKKPDPRMNTIDQDPEYLAFVEAINNPEAAASSISTGESSLDKLEKKLITQQQQFIADKTAAVSGGLENRKSTPLLDHLRAKKLAMQQAKEARLKEKFKSGKRGTAPPPPPPPSPKRKGRERELPEKSKGKVVGASDKLKSEITKTLLGPKSSRESVKAKFNSEGTDAERAATPGDGKDDKKPDGHLSRKERRARKMAGLDKQETNDMERSTTPTADDKRGVPLPSRRKSKKFDIPPQCGSSGKNEPAHSEPISGPRVVLTKRDGTKSAFNVGDENE